MKLHVIILLKTLYQEYFKVNSFPKFLICPVHVNAIDRKLHILRNARYLQRKFPIVFLYLILFPFLEFQNLSQNPFLSLIMTLNKEEAKFYMSIQFCQFRLKVSPQMSNTAQPTFGLSYLKQKEHVKL